MLPSGRFSFVLATDCLSSHGLHLTRCRPSARRQHKEATTRKKCPPRGHGVGIARTDDRPIDNAPGQLSKLAADLAARASARFAGLGTTGAAIRTCTPRGSRRTGTLGAIAFELESETSGRLNVGRKHVWTHPSKPAAARIADQHGNAARHRCQAAVAKIIGEAIHHLSIVCPVHAAGSAGGPTVSQQIFAGSAVIHSPLVFMTVTVSESCPTLFNIPRVDDRMCARARRCRVLRQRSRSRRSRSRRSRSERSVFVCIPPSACARSLLRTQPGPCARWTRHLRTEITRNCQDRKR